MSEQSHGPGWWQASDGNWYPPEQHPSYAAPKQPMTKAGKAILVATLGFVVLMFGTCVAFLGSADVEDDETAVSTERVEDRLPRATTTERQTTTTERRSPTTTEATVQALAAPTTAAVTAPPTTSAPRTTAAPATTAAPKPTPTTAPPTTSAPTTQPPTTAAPATSSPPTTSGTVNSGSYCSPAGATGHESAGTPMTCSTHSCDGDAYDRPRWRRTTC